MKVPLLVFLAFEVLCGACTQAQDVSDSTPVLRGGATLVLVPTLIKTSGGEPVFGFTASDFTLTDDGIEQKISLEEITSRTRRRVAVRRGANLLPATRHGTRDQPRRSKPTSPLVLWSVR